MLLTALAFLFSAIQAQTGTDLEFSRTILECGTNPNNPNAVGTVPAGKIWKVTGHSALNPGNSTEYIYLDVDGKEVSLARKRSSTSVDDVIYSQLPIYINENSVVNLFVSANNGSCVSIIEYTVVQ